MSLALSGRSILGIAIAVIGVLTMAWGATQAAHDFEGFKTLGLGGVIVLATGLCLVSEVPTALRRDLGGGRGERRVHLHTAELGVPAPDDERSSRGGPRRVAHHPAGGLGRMQWCRLAETRAAAPLCEQTALRRLRGCR